MERTALKKSNPNGAPVGSREAVSACYQFARPQMQDHDR
jgi:hypothetical protein